MKSKAFLLTAVLSQLTCHQVIFHAPPGATMECVCNPRAVSASSGVSVVSCLLMEEIGTPVADGTVVQFFTDLGRIPEQGKTNDGVVRVNFESDGRSGTANISAFSGSGSGGPAPTSSSTSSTLVQRSGVSSSAAFGSAASSALLAESGCEVSVGNINVDEIQVSASPSRLTSSRTSTITANVFDGAGNPVAGVPVFFEVGQAQNIGPTPVPGTPTPPPSATPTSPGDTGQGLETLESQGSPVFTDTNGQARDVLRTRYPSDARQRSVTVRAFVPGGPDDDVTIIIN